MTLTSDHPEVANVARRSVLLGLAAGSFVLSVRLSSPALAQEKKFGGDGMPGGREGRSDALPLHRRGRHRQPRCASAPRWARASAPAWPWSSADELDADLGSRQGRCRRRATRRASATRTPTARAARATHFDAASPHRARRRRQMLERGSGRRVEALPVSEVKAREPRHASMPRSGRRLDFGALAKGAAARPVPARGQDLVLKGRAQFRYIGKDNVPLIDNLDITTGKAMFGIDTRRRRHGLCRRRAPAGVRRQGQELRCRQGDEGAGRAQGRARSTRQRRRRRVPAAGRRRRDRGEHLRRHQGALALEIQLGRRAERQRTTPARTATPLEAAAAKPGKVVRNDGDVDARAGRCAPSACRRNTTCRISRAGADGAAVGHRARRRRQGCEVWCSTQNAEAVAHRPRRQALQRADRQGHRARHCCWVAASAASPSPTSPARRRSVARPWAASR